MFRCAELDSHRYSWLQRFCLISGLMQHCLPLCWHFVAAALSSVSMGLKRLFPLFFLLLALVAKAGDIAMDVRQTSVDSHGGGFFEIGLGLEYISGINATATGEDDEGVGLELNIGGAYFYKGFFIEAAVESYDGLNLGYQVLGNQDWSIDLLASSLSGEFFLDSENRAKSADEQLVERNSLYNGAGLRVTRYLGDYVLQGRLVNDIYKDNGLRASARFGRNWQLRNWNLHSIASVDYASEKTTRYLVGITEAEATERFAAYQPDAGMALSLELGAAYPVNEHLVWNTRLLHTRYSDEVADSPLLTDDNFTGFRTTLNYVF